MNPSRLKHFPLVLAVVLAILTTGTGFYLSRIHFAGDFYIKLLTEKQLQGTFNIEAITPLNNAQPFYPASDGMFNLSGYYSAIYIKADSGIAQQLTQEDSLYIKLGSSRYTLPFDLIAEQWTSRTSGRLIIYEMPPGLQKLHLLAKIQATVAHTGFAPVAVIAWFILLLLALLAVYVGMHFQKPFQLLSSRLSTRKAALFSALLMCVYFMAFGVFNTYTDSVPLSGDSWEYQTMGVNLARGHGVQRLSLLEPFADYKFDTQEVDSESLYNLKISPYYIVDTYRTPAYSLFLGLVYKLFGLNPSIVKVIQLLLLCFVAAFSAWLFYRLWQFKGMCAGLAGGVIFLLNYNHLAHDIMTEVLLIFFSFLLVSLAVIYEENKSLLTASLLGLVCALALLTKGMLIFVITFYLIYQMILYFRTKEKKVRGSIRMLFAVFVLGLLPWTIYASYINKFMLIEPISKTQIITATSRVEAIFGNTVIDENNIVNVVGDINEIYYSNKYWDENRYIFVKDFVQKHPGVVKQTYATVIDFVKKEINQFYKAHLSYMAVPWFNKQYLYVNLKGFTVLSIQARTLLLESNNEHGTDGGWHPEARHESYYYKNDNKNQPAFFRVINFYMHHPEMILKIFPAKVHTGFKNFFLAQLFCLLVIFMNIVKKRKHILAVLLLIIPLFLILTRQFPSLLIIIVSGATVLAIFKYLYKKNPYELNMPRIFNLFLLNTLLITVVFYGLDRFTLITEFLVIPVSVMYLVCLLKKTLREDTGIINKF